jgi:hypothetical protein
MSTSTLDNARTVELPQISYRPARPARGVGRWFRRVAGIKEDLLDWVPEERARYARLGAIVVNTGLVAAVSLQTALGKVVETHWALLIPAALGWGFVIMTFDGWLIASTHGVNGTKARIFIPRLAVSVLMGAVIAEPLLLFVFQPAVQKEVHEHRQQEMIAHESLLRQCNPESGAEVSGAHCDGHRLNSGATPAAIQAQLQAAIKQRDTDQAEVNRISGELAKRQELARLECNGTSGAGLTGRPGVGPNCRRNREEADQYHRDSRIDQRQADLVALNQRITELTAQTKNAAQTYAAAVAAEIERRVAEKRAAHGKVGLLEEMAALERLARDSTFVLIGHWLVRFLLIAIDCLPVLTKIMSGTTTYDLLLNRQLEASRRLHDRDIGVAEQADLANDELRSQRTARELRVKLEQLNDADRERRIHDASTIDRQIDALAERLLHDPMSVPTQRNPTT